MRNSHPHRYLDIYSWMAKTYGSLLTVPKVNYICSPSRLAFVIVERKEVDEGKGLLNCLQVMFVMIAQTRKVRRT